MSVATLVLGESGQGKSTSLRNMNPVETLLIQTIKKPLPFRSSTWKYFNPESEKTGSIFVRDNSDEIIAIMNKTKRKVIVIDDWNLIMTNDYMRRSDEKGFQKFSDIGRSAWNLLMASSSLPDDVRVYLLGHTEVSETGQTKAKTIGKMLDQTCPVESMLTIVLKTKVVNGNYLFSTVNNGQDTVKVPMGLFETENVENDLQKVDDAIVEYFNLKPPTSK